MVNSGELFNAFSSYFKILENVGQYPQQDTNRLILLSFIQKMKVDGYYATLSEKDKKTVDELVECLKKKLCITPYAITCIKKQAEKIFIGDYEGCIFNNAAVPEYVDMNPVWQTESTACEVNSSGYNTGIKTEYQTNINPNYHGVQTKTTRSIDPQHCPNNAPSWTEIGRECEVSGGYNTGYQIVTYRDTNINSATYNTTRTEKVLNTDACPLPDTNPHWVETSRACNTVQYQHSSNPLASHTTGYATVVEQDINPASSTYEDTRTDENVPDENCPLEQIGYLTFDDDTVTKSATTDYQSDSYTLLLKYYLNDVLQNSIDVSVSAPAGITYSIDAANKTVTINVAKNTTGADRTMVTTITGNHGNAITFSVFQTGNSVFTFDNNLTTKTVNNILAAGYSWTETIISLAGDTPIGFSKTLIYSGMTATVNSNSTVSIAVSQNPSTSPRDLHLELKQQGSNKIIHLTAKQLGSPVPSDNYVFTANPITISNILAAGETKNVAVTSTKNGNAQAYSVDNANSTAISSGMATVTITAAGISIVVSANSSASVRTGKVVLKQDTSNNTVEIDLSQNAAVIPDTYVFTWQGGGDSDKSLSAGSDGDSAAFTVVSTKNGSSQGFIISSASTASSFATASINGSTVTVTVPANTGTTAQSGYFLLRQNDSGKELKINVSLAAPAFVFSWPSGLPNPAPLTVSHTHGTYIMPVISTRNGVNVVYTIDSVSSSISAWTISRNSNDNSLEIQTTTGDRFNTITGDIVLKQNISENTLTLSVTQQSEHVITPMLSIDSGSAVIGQQANKRVVTLTLTPAAAVNAAITDIIYGDLTVEFKGDTEADSPTYWEVAGPMTYLGSNQVSLTIDIGEHQWSDYFNFRLYKTSSTDTYGTDSASKSIIIPHS